MRTFSAMVMTSVPGLVPGTADAVMIFTCTAEHTAC